MTAYDYLAKHYDQWMDHDAYLTWIEWIKAQLKSRNLTGIKILELCCGTGRVTLPLAREGYSIWAVDRSEEMLAVAQQKSADLITRIKWIQSDMLTLTLKERFDAVLCINDGINYLDDFEALKTYFKVCHQHLKPSGLLIFDWSSPYKLKTILGDKTIAETHEESAFIWENHYTDDGVQEFEFHIFEKCPNGQYNRFVEYHRQISFTIDQIELASKGLFTIEHMVGDHYAEISENDQRFYTVMRKETP